MNKIISPVILTMGLAIATSPAATAGDDVKGEIKVDSLSTGFTDTHMVLAMALNLDSLDLASNRRIIYTPLLIGDQEGDTATFPAVAVNGRRQHIMYQRNHKNLPDIEIERHNGKPQSLPYTSTVAYQPWMENSTLYLVDDLCGCGDILSSNRTPLLTIAPPPAPQIPVLTCFVTPQVEAVKTRSEKGSAFIDFRVNRTEIHPEYRRNTEELAKILATIQLVRDNSDLSITRLGIHGYASPEGPYNNNIRLAQGRAKTLAEYVMQLSNLKEVEMSVESTPEDWQGLRDYVATSDLADRDAILSIIDSSLDPDPKDAKIKRDYPAEYAFLLKEVYPALRHSDYEVEYTVRPFNVEEARQIIRKNPKQLSLNEMFMVAQSYPAGSEEFNEVFDIAVRLYPDDPVANLNAAIASFNRGDYDSATRFVNRAGDLPQAAEVKEALSLITMQ